MDTRLWVKSPVAVGLLSIITCGIYFIIWLYCIRLQLKTYLQDDNIHPGLDVILSLICFPYVVYLFYLIGKDIIRAEEKANMNVTDNSVLYLALALFGLSIVNCFIVQGQLNEVWSRSNA